MSEPLLVARGIEKSYRMGTSVIEVLRGLDLEIGEGEVVAVVAFDGWVWARRVRAAAVRWRGPRTTGLPSKAPT